MKIIFNTVICRIFLFARRYKYFLIFLLSIFLYECFYDVAQDKKLRTFWGTRIYVFFQDLSPEEAKKMVVKESEKNPQYEIYDNNSIWVNMFVAGDEYFFPVRWPKDTVDEEGYYVNPKTREVRYVKSDYVFNLPFFYDSVSIRL